MPIQPAVEPAVMDQTTHWPHRHLVGIEPLSAAEIRTLLQKAQSYEGVSTSRALPKNADLHGKVVVNLFYEDSTRTRASFRLAASRLSADVLDMSASGSSVSKGETLVDTARNIEAMGVDIVVCRHNQSGAAIQLANAISCSVVNAGDGQHEHPTQALLDAFTIAKRLSRDDSFDFTGLTVAIVGDIGHSRVARSNAHCLTKLGAKVVLVGPPTLLPGSFEALDCEMSHDLDDVLPRVDVVNMLRVQFERLSGPAFPSQREYTTLYGLSRSRMSRAKKDLVVMHPGPMNRGLEIESAVADGPNSVILDQVANGLAVRMATLALVAST
ncbi:MAG: aspartate carbamoyltransferase catalytic subunit [Phycisphaeraceae bacterium]